MPNKLILASSSPRRREVLQSLGLDFAVETSDVEETFSPDTHPVDVVRQLAVRKAQAVARRHTNARQSEAAETAEAAKLDTLILAADTIVVDDGEILGKPSNAAHALQMLTQLQGHTHDVYTGVCLIRLSDEHMETAVEHTRVTMGQADAHLLTRYVDSGDPLDKAGAYGIQGPGAVLVERIEGDYFTVVGLPVRRVALMLAEFGMDVLKP